MIGGGWDRSSPASGPTTRRWRWRSPRSPPPGRPADGKRSIVVARWHWWADRQDVGNQTRSVLTGGRRGTDARTAREVSAVLHARTGHTAGNGSLMRTAPVALATSTTSGLVEAARAVCALTHFDPEAGEACVLWCLAIRHAVLTGEFDVR